MRHRSNSVVEFVQFAGADANEIGGNANTNQFAQTLSAMTSAASPSGSGDNMLVVTHFVVDFFSPVRPVNGVDIAASPRRWPSSRPSRTSCSTGLSAALASLISFRRRRRCASAIAPALARAFRRPSSRRFTALCTRLCLSLFVSSRFRLFNPCVPLARPHSRARSCSVALILPNLERIDMPLLESIGTNAAGDFIFRQNFISGQGL